ncbi:gamma-glutamyltransferase family protein [Salisediminibacterium beveridgei]|uniref:Gamma-glutamyltranspeptidase PgsD/CapD n=1 Tax=Salisediminibacterium beveridgei TaxID=632773 RepID=A0A1D7QRV3_9BACI|nr:gamma-glutamyltransferase [Salisediminibacterium beveridgei]AOM81744.1 Gamma-glutamyltranspeptidase PgsD/CapD [Salisediminibacterium beveridgei]
MKHYKRYLNTTYSLASLILIGLIAWTFYFQDEFDIYREPYVGGDFEERQQDSIAISSNESDPMPESDNNNANEENPAAEDELEPFPDIYGVSAIHPLAAEEGMKIIEEGGNAIDAAITVSFVLNVVEPYGSGIGGGGMMLAHERGEGAVTYDYREAAPVTGTAESPFAVPGLVKGMEKAFEEQGSGNIPWEDLLEPAYEYASRGFDVGQVLHEQLANYTRYVQFDTQATRDLYYPGGQPIPVNDTLVQEELAETLKRIMEEGAADFYEGETAQAMQEAFGFNEEDLTSYEADVTEPVKAESENYSIFGASAPSSATVVLQSFLMAEQLDLSQVLAEDDYNALSEQEDDPRVGHLMNDNDHLHSYIHLMTEITDTAYQERLDNLGDPDFETIEQSDFTSQETIDRLLDQLYNGSSASRVPGDTLALHDAPGEINDSRHTTHFVILDQDGMMVSATNSVGQFFGSGHYSDGIFINSQMANFSGDDTSPNSFAPGKRPRTFVSPVILEQDGQAVLGMGSPGGRRIPAMIFQTLMQYEYGQAGGERVTLQEAIEHPRFYTEDGVVHVEERLEAAINSRLRGEGTNMRYTVIEHGSPLFYGGIQSLGVEMSDGNVENLFGGGDPRRRGVWQIESAE